MLVGKDLRGTDLLGQKEYRRRMALILLYSLIWALALFGLQAHWHELATSIKVIAAIMLVIGTPSIQDLFRRHDTYAAEWTEANN